MMIDELIEKLYELRREFGEREVKLFAPEGVYKQEELMNQQQ